jgi:fermentation-respiration switch protein FrsA (DUF1100 family)
MGDAISSLLFQPPPPTRLKESKVIWLTNSHGKRIPSFFVECAVDERTGEGMRAPHPGEPSQHLHRGGGTDADIYGKGGGGGYNASGGVIGGVPSSPHIRTPKELEMTVAMGRRLGHGAPTILYSHANAEDLGNIYPWCKFLSKMLGVNIFAYDYTGYGLATDQGAFISWFGVCLMGLKAGGGGGCGGWFEIFSIHCSRSVPYAHRFTRPPPFPPLGPPSEDYCFADITAAYAYLTYVLQIPPSSIVLYGRSLGSGPSCFLAARTAEEGDAVGGLILHAPFLSVYRIVIDSGCTLPGDRFPNVDFAPSIRSPVLFIHGTKDSIVPFNHSERLLETILEPYRADPVFIKGMGHNNVHASVRPMFIDRLRRYFDRHVLPNIRAERMLGPSRISLDSRTRSKKQLARLVDVDVA